MSRFSTQELFLAGMTVVVVGFTVSVGSPSLASLVGVSDSGKSSGDSQGTGENRPSMSPPSEDTRGSGEQDNQYVPEKTDGNNQPVSEEEWKQSAESRQQELIRQAEEGYQRTLQEYWKSISEEQKRAAGEIQELSRGDGNMNKNGTINTKDGEAMKRQQEYIDAMRKQDINKDSTVDQSDVEKLQEMMKQHHDINGDGVVDDMDVQRIQKMMQERKMAPNDMNRDGVVTPEEEYGYMQKEKVPEVNEKEETVESEVSVWDNLKNNLKKTFFQGDTGEEKVDYTVEYAPDGSIKSTTINQYTNDEHPLAEDSAPQEESLWSKLNPFNWFKSNGTTPQGRPFNGMPVPGKPFNDEVSVKGRPFQEGDTGEEKTAEPSYEDLLKDRNGVNAVPLKKSHVFFDTEEKPESSVSLGKGETAMPPEAQKTGESFLDTIKGWFGL